MAVIIMQWLERCGANRSWEYTNVKVSVTDRWPDWCTQTMGETNQRERERKREQERGRGGKHSGTLLLTGTLTSVTHSKSDTGASILAGVAAAAVLDQAAWTSSVVWRKRQSLWMRVYGEKDNHCGWECMEKKIITVDESARRKRQSLWMRVYWSK